MKKLFLILTLLSLPFISNAQVSDTVYVDELDTVIVKEDPIIVNKTVYHKLPEKNNNFLSIIPSAGILLDISNYEVCETCKTAFNKLRSSSSLTSSVQYGIQMKYIHKKISVGIDVDYRHSSKNIDYSNDSTIQFKSRINVHYFMVGPSIGYKIMQRKLWDLDFNGGVLFSFTTAQSGKTIGGDGISTLIDLGKTALIARNNFLYHLAPALTYKVKDSLGVSLILHYYFDNNSNVTKQQPYTEQRNSLGFSIGIKYSL
jgi:hypothetical protein